MLLSLNVLLDQLRDLTLECHVSNPGRHKFSRPALLNQSSTATRDDLIYLCRLSEALNAEAAGTGAIYLCVRDRISDETETEQLLQSMVIINENVDLGNLFSRVQDIFTKVNEWYIQMQQALIHEQDLQRILDLSEQVLGNTINISDSTFSLLACTRNLDTDDGMSLDLRKYGCHPEHTVQKLIDQRRFKTWEQAQDIFINDSYLLSSYVLVSKVFRLRNAYFTHMVMVCDHHPLSEGLLELYSLLLEILAVYAERNWKDRNELRHNYDSLFHDLLRGELTDPDDIQERVKYLNLPTSGPFQLLKLAAEPGMEAGLDHIGQELSNMLPNAQVMRYEQSVLAVVSLRDNGTSDVPFEDIKRLLARHKAQAGFSDAFSSLAQLPKAHNQAALALKCRATHRGAALFADAPIPRLRFFRDWSIHGLLGEIRDDHWIWRDGVYYKSLEALYDYDKKHGSTNLQLLRCYLRNERKATPTGKELHMHRNNVIYHIERIEKITQLDLDDYTVRLGLEIGFLLLEINGFSSRPSS